jgi:hypothetical protein
VADGGPVELGIFWRFSVGNADRRHLHRKRSPRLPIMRTAAGGSLWAGLDKIEVEGMPMPNLDRRGLPPREERSHGWTIFDD